MCSLAITVATNGSGDTFRAWFGLGIGHAQAFPVDIDNPLNGNMYKPLYFDGGQAIHGANNVPTTPQSKGCARLRPGDQDLLIGWLGLADAEGPTNSADRINVTVNVQGAYPHTEAEIDAALAELAAEED